MKKTLLVTIDFPPQDGGVARYLDGLVDQLPKDKIAVLIPPMKGGGKKDFAYEVYRRRLFWPFWPKWWPMVRQVVKVANKERVEMLWAAQPLPVGTVVLMVSKFLRLPYIINTHGMDIAGPLAKGGRRLNVLTRVLKGATKITYNSLATKKLLQQFDLPEEKLIQVFPCPAVLTPATAEQTQKVVEKYKLQGKKILLSVGRLVERKGHDMVIKSLPQILAKVPDLVYLIVGDGPNKQNLVKLIKELNLERNVVLAGFIPDNELAAHYGASRAFIMPAREVKGGDIEGFGVVFQEANSLGLPVIAGNTGGQTEVVIDGLNGLVVDPYQVTDISSAVLRLIGDRELCERLGRAGKEYAAKFNWTTEAKKIEKILS